jgi:hypothetical protein
MATSRGRLVSLSSLHHRSAPDNPLA